MKNLVIMPFGRDSRRSPWLGDSSGRAFDVLLLAYHDPAEMPDLDLRSPHYRVEVLGDFKWIMIQKLFALHPELCSSYEYFFFVDDDIEMESSGITDLFYLAKKYKLLMTQPVLSRDSFKSWKVLRRKWLSGIRYISSVELMCPMMHREAVQQLLPTFSLNRSGWGIDILWGERIRTQYGDRRIGVFDQVTARHMRPVGKGELYEKLGKPAHEERDEIFQKFQLKDSTIYELPLRENSLLERANSYWRIRKELKGQSG